MSTHVCPEHGTTPNPLCHVQQAAPRIRRIESTHEDRANLAVGCAFLLAAGVMAVGAWVVWTVWLLG